jgi:hypothetical protein
MLKKDTFENHMIAFKLKVNKMFFKYDLDLIVYDEFESFKPANDNQYNYPYELRKNKIARHFFDMSISDTITGQYDYMSDKIQF